MRKPNRYDLLPDGSVLIHLSRGKVAIIDARDLPKMLPYRWQATVSGRLAWRAMGRVEGTLTYLHVHLFGKGMDHRNRNPLDNRRCNVRPATWSQNLANRAAYGKHSRYKGVYPNKAKWIAKIVKERRVYFSPSFQTQEEAALWYNEKAQELHGAFAVLNVLDQ